MHPFKSAILPLLIITVFTLHIEVHAQTDSTLTQIGRGDVQSIEWYPGGEYILVSTITGTWIYTWFMQEVAHLPDAHLATVDPNGRFIAAVDANNGVVLLNADTLDVSRILTNRFTHVWDMAWSPDGHYLAISGEQGFTELYVFDASDWIGGISTRNAGKKLLWSPTGVYLASYTPGSGGTIWGFDGSGSYAAQFSVATESAVYWQDANTLLTYEVEDTYYRVTEWDAVTGESSDAGRNSYVSDFYSSNGRIKAQPNWDSVIIQDFDHPERSFEIPIFTASDNLTRISTVRWSRDQRYVAVGTTSIFLNAPAIFAIVDVETQAIRHQFAEGIEGIEHIVWSYAGRWVIVVDKHERIFVYDVESGEQVGSTDAHALVGDAIAWSPDSTQTAIGNTGDTVSIWDVNQNTQVSSLTDNGWAVTQIEWQADGSRIGVQTSETMWNPNTNIQLWDMSADSPQNITENFTSVVGQPITHFDFSGDGTRLALVSSLHVYLYDVSMQIPILVLEDTLGYKPESIDLNFAGDRMIYRRDIFGGAYPFRTAEEQARFRIDLLPAADQVQVWSGSDEVVSIIWDSWDHSYTPEVNPWLQRSINGSDQTNTLLLGSQHIITHGFISPNGTFVGAIDDNNSGYIWDAHTGNLVAWTANTLQMRWSPDETHLAILSTDGSAWILESDGTILERLPRSPSVQEASGTFVWSPDNRQLAHLHDGVLDIWDTSSD